MVIPLTEAYRTCETLARTHYENFPVASRLLPKRMRPHIAAVYAFARTADDLADEGSAGADVRRRRLHGFRDRLRATVAGLPPAPDSREQAALFAALGHTIRTCSLPVALFEDLLSAFEQDTITHRYDSWRDLCDYCRRSANPVGRLVLRIAGLRDETIDRSSDALCTALQLTNFWQDFGRDWRAGRLYVPREVYESTGAEPSDLEAGRMTEAWVRAIARCAEETRRQFDEGRLVCDAVGGRLRFELRLTWLGGRRVLESAVGRGDRLLDDRPALGARDALPLLMAALRWKTVTRHAP